MSARWPPSTADPPHDSRGANRRGLRHHELLELAIGGTQRPEQVQAWIDDPNRVVMVDHEMRGVILGTSVGGEAEITDVAVTPEHRRTGIGKALIHAFVQRPTGDADSIGVFGSSSQQRGGHRPLPG